MATTASDHPDTIDAEKTAAAGQLVMRPSPCACCGKRPSLARWVMVGDPPQWACSAACLKAVLSRTHRAAG